MATQKKDQNLTQDTHIPNQGLFSTHFASCNYTLLLHWTSSIKENPEKKKTHTHTSKVPSFLLFNIHPWKKNKKQNYPLSTHLYQPEERCTGKMLGHVGQLAMYKYDEVLLSYLFLLTVLLVLFFC